MPHPVSAPDYMPVLPASPATWAQAYEGKVRSSPALVAGEDTAVFIVAGQSLAASTAQGLYTPTNASKVDNLSPHTGATYKGADPLLGCTVRDDLGVNYQANPFTRVADALVSSGAYDRVILVPCAKGGTSIATWESSLYQWIIGAYRRALAVGLPITAICWQQGENDTYAGTSEATYLSAFRSMRGKIMAAGCVAPWVLAKSTRITGGATSSAVRSAIDTLISDIGILAGPDTDTLDGTYRYDDQHWNATGNAAAAALWGSALRAVL